jgi:hypothetical protein
MYRYYLKMPVFKTGGLAAQPMLFWERRKHGCFLRAYREVFTASPKTIIGAKYATDLSSWQ